LVDGLRRGLDRHPGLAVAGAALDGVGIAACLASAKTAADKISTDLRSVGVG
jgi:oxygen-dependent protoporphyrinogen oxidase